MDEKKDLARILTPLSNYLPTYIIISYSSEYKYFEKNNLI